MPSWPSRSPTRGVTPSKDPTTPPCTRCGSRRTRVIRWVGSRDSAGCRGAMTPGCLCGVSKGRGRARMAVARRHSPAESRRIASGWCTTPRTRWHRSFAERTMASPSAGSADGAPLQHRQFRDPSTGGSRLRPRYRRPGAWCVDCARGRSDHPRRLHLWMPAFTITRRGRATMSSPRKDPTRGTWYFVEDLPSPNGKRRQVKRRGFPTKKAAEHARREFLVCVPNMERSSTRRGSPWASI